MDAKEKLLEALAEILDRPENSGTSEHIDFDAAMETFIIQAAPEAKALIDAIRDKHNFWYD